MAKELPLVGDKGDAAMVVDVANIHCSLLAYGQRVDAHGLYQHGAKHGVLLRAIAVADYRKIPLGLWHDFAAAGFQLKHVPSPTLPSGKQKDISDVACAVAVWSILRDQPHVTTIVLCTGDVDFVPVSTYLRDVLGKQFVVAGVPGTIAAALLEGAVADPLPVRSRPPSDRDKRVIRVLLSIDENADGVSREDLVDHFVQSKKLGGMSVRAAASLLDQLVLTGVVHQLPVHFPGGLQAQAMHLNRQHPSVKEVVAERQASWAA